MQKQDAHNTGGNSMTGIPFSGIQVDSLEIIIVIKLEECFRQALEHSEKILENPSKKIENFIVPFKLAELCIHLLGSAKINNNTTPVIIDFLSSLADEFNQDIGSKLKKMKSSPEINIISLLQETITETLEKIKNHQDDIESSQTAA